MGFDGLSRSASHRQATGNKMSNAPVKLSELAFALMIADGQLDNAVAEERRWRSGELFAAIEAGTLNVRVGATYPLADAAKAHEDLAARLTTGKVLLVP